MIRAVGVRVFAAAIAAGAFCSLATPSSADPFGPTDAFNEPDDWCPEGDDFTDLPLPLVDDTDPFDDLPPPPDYPAFP